MLWDGHSERDKALDKSTSASSRDNSSRMGIPPRIRAFYEAVLVVKIEGPEEPSFNWDAMFSASLLALYLFGLSNVISREVNLFFCDAALKENKLTNGVVLSYNMKPSLLWSGLFCYDQVEKLESREDIFLPDPHNLLPDTAPVFVFFSECELLT